MNDNQKRWNENQKGLRQKLEKGEDFETMWSLLLTQHQMTHASAVGHGAVWSYEDEIWQGISADTARLIPAKYEHSLIWIFWHLARVEDVTMNCLVAGREEVLYTENFIKRINTPIEDTGNEITPQKMRALNNQINIHALKAYRIAVGKRTQSIIQNLQVNDVLQKVDSERITQLRSSNAVVPSASGIIDYWSKRTIAGLLLMPATRHNFVHLNEAARIKKALT